MLSSPCSSARDRRLHDVMKSKARGWFAIQKLKDYDVLNHNFARGFVWV